MCMIDDGVGIVTMINEGRYFVARGIHRCGECGRDIKPSERYHRESYVFEGDFKMHKTCVHCMVVRGWLTEECGGWLFGQIEEDAREHVFDSPGHYRMDVYRAVVGMQWCWRSPSGRLLPVPVRIKTSDEYMS